MSKIRKKRGQLAENHAVLFLKNRGYSVIAQNWKVKIGELDIIAQKDKILVFIEVKALTTEEYYPEDHVDYRKSRKLVQLAELFLAKHPVSSYDYRIDVIAVQLNLQTRRLSIRHYKNAIEA